MGRFAQRTLRAGAAVLLFGCSPLLIFLLVWKLDLLRDPNPNPVGLGILCYLSFPFGVALLLIGAILKVTGRSKRTTD